MVLLPETARHLQESAATLWLSLPHLRSIVGLVIGAEVMNRVPGWFRRDNRLFQPDARPEGTLTLAVEDGRRLVHSPALTLRLSTLL